MQNSDELFIQYEDELLHNSSIPVEKNKKAELICDYAKQSAQMFINTIDQDFRGPHSSNWTKSSFIILIIILVKIWLEQIFYWA